MPKFEIELTEPERELLLNVVFDAKVNAEQQLLHIPAPELSWAAGRLHGLHQKLIKATAR